MDHGTATCELCGRCAPLYDEYGQKMFKEFDGKLLCMNHYSQARWPETYTKIAPVVQDLLADE